MLTLCVGQDCPLKYDCYRFSIEAYGRQNYFGSSPFDGQKCAYFVENTPQLQQLAYYVWLEEGKPEGKQTHHWEVAKTKLRELKEEKP